MENDKEQIKRLKTHLREVEELRHKQEQDGFVTTIHDPPLNLQGPWPAEDYLEHQCLKPSDGAQLVLPNLHYPKIDREELYKDMLDRDPVPFPDGKDFLPLKLNTRSAVPFPDPQFVETMRQWFTSGTEYEEAEELEPHVGMTRDEFDEVVSELDDYIAGLRDTKEAEYASKEDTLKNFHNAGPFLGMKPSQYCMVLLTKHIQGVAHQVMRGKYLWEFKTESGDEGLKQRLADIKNYTDLLFALLHEENKV